MTHISSEQPGFIRSPFSVAGGPMQLLASTDVQGFAKQNATPNILQWTAPNDGQAHRIMANVAEIVTALETGGQVSVTTTPPGPGAAAVTTAIIAAGAGAGTNYGNLSNRSVFPVAPGSTVTIQQTTALTAGGPTTVFAEIYGS